MDSNVTDDLALGVALGSRDEAEFEALFLAHYDGVYRLLFRIVGSQQEAEDLSQEAFLRLYRHRFPEGREHNVRAWLYRVAANLAYNALRSRQRREQRQAVVARQSATVGDPPPDPADSTVRSDERETVRRVLASLPARQAQLLLLRHAGLSYRELAEALDVAPGSIGTLLARATVAFQAAYGTEVSGPEREPRDGRRQERQRVGGMEP